MSTKFQATVVPIVMTAVALTSNASLTARAPLSIRVSPAAAFAPSNLFVRTTIEPDSSNRAIEIVADSDQFYRSSLVQLDGDRAPKTSIFEFRSLPSGEYEVKAALIGVGGHERAIARAHVTVIESGAAR